MTVLPANPKGRPAEELARACLSLRALGIRDREMYSLLFRKTLEENPDFFGIWSVWEPDAFDGLDREFRSSPGHDGTGRFVPYWHRRHGQLTLDPVTGYEKAGPGDWYWVPMNSRRLCVMEPYMYPVGGSRFLLTSQVAPVISDGQCLGATGVDISVEYLAERTLKTRRASRCSESNSFEDLLERGMLFLSKSGEILYWTNRSRELLARYFNQPEIRLPREVLQALEARSDLAAQLRFRHGCSELVVSIMCLRKEIIVLLSEETIAHRAVMLTSREREVHHWLAQGKSNDQIARILGISIHTVKNHLDHIFEKLGVDNRVAAAMASLDEPLAA
jgi:DNA-binding CsgD family transcriptional regulator